MKPWEFWTTPSRWRGRKRAAKRENLESVFMPYVNGGSKVGHSAA